MNLYHLRKLLYPKLLLVVLKKGLPLVHTSLGLKNSSFVPVVTPLLVGSFIILLRSMLDKSKSNIDIH
jgi:hypothetical protein